jgi:hypothetical protein
MDMFVPADFDPPARFETERFVLVPLDVEHNERDHEAWMSSIDHIHGTPGFPDGPWPREMTLEENERDLARHAQHFAERKGFTYTVLVGDEVVGCVYIYPSDSEADADVRSWVRASHAELDVALYETVTWWLADAWPFERVDYARR